MVTMEQSAMPVQPSDIDWSQWAAPGKDDVRGPCPALNSLANHGILPRDGRGLTRSMVATALSNSINFSPVHGRKVMDAAFKALPPGSQTITLAELGKHGVIEHDVSFSRDDVAFGNAMHLSPEVWNPSKALIRGTGGCEVLNEEGEQLATIENIAKAKHARMLASRRKHLEHGKPFSYTFKVMVTNYIEMASFLLAFGDAAKGVTKAEYIDVWFEQERMPYKEGWRRPEKEYGGMEMLSTSGRIWWANEHKLQELGILLWSTATLLFSYLLPASKVSTS